MPNGIDAPLSSIRKITQCHADKIHQQHERKGYPITEGCVQQIIEMDGYMLLIVTPAEDGDKRAIIISLHWQEVRLALAHEQGKTTPKFNATFQTGVDAAGQSLLNCAVAAGLGVALRG